MTKEQAIIQLEYRKDFATPDQIEALDMAISALSEELSEDGTLTVHVSDGSKVNRVFVMGDNIFGGLYYPDSAENKTQMIDKSNFDPEQYKADLQSAYDCGYNMALSENKGEWIPVSERLPKPYEQVLRTVKSIGGNSTSHSYVDLGSICPIDTDVIAWQPLPEPYKKGE